MPSKLTNSEKTYRESFTNKFTFKLKVLNTGQLVTAYKILLVINYQLVLLGLDKISLPNIKKASSWEKAVPHQHKICVKLWKGPSKMIEI